jgi:hypothetical protein
LATRYDVKMLWVSERRELTLPDAKKRKLAAALNGKDITHCKIPSEGFMPRDNHPNVLGYEVLKACVEGLLRTW